MNIFSTSQKHQRERKAQLVLKTWKETNYRTEFVFHVPDSFLDREISVFFLLFSSSNNMKKDNKIYFCISIPRHVNNLLVSPFICSKNASFLCTVTNAMRFHSLLLWNTQKNRKKTKGGKVYFCAVLLQKVLFNVNSFNVMRVIRSLFPFILREPTEHTGTHTKGTMMMLV